jgi:hypothetical protein
MNSARPNWITNNKKYKTTHKVFDYGRREWRNFAEKHKKNNPFCAHCIREGKTKIGEISDHIIPINAGGSVWDLRNLQNLCRVHDNIKRSNESRGIILPTYGDYGDLLPATSLDLYSFDIDWINININDIYHLYDINKSSIILGAPASGKTTLSLKLSFEHNIDLIHSDDHIGEPNDMVNQCKYIINNNKYYHLEGSLSHLMLMHGVKYMPGVIVWIDYVDVNRLYKRYKENRDIRKFDIAISNYYKRMHDTLKEIERSHHNILKYRII